MSSRERHEAIRRPLIVLEIYTRKCIHVEIPKTFLQIVELAKPNYFESIYTNICGDIILFPVSGFAAKRIFMWKKCGFLHGNSRYVEIAHG